MRLGTSSSRGCHAARPPSIVDIDKTQNLADPAMPGSGGQSNAQLLPSKAAATSAKSVPARTPQPQPIDKQVARQVAKSVTGTKKSVKA